jgi:hypothetical protein
MKTTPESYRDAECCFTCIHQRVTHCCGCCPTEYWCDLHKCDCGETNVCDDYRGEPI